MFKFSAMALFNLIRAFFKGEALFHVETWKNTQLASETLVVVLVAIFGLMPDLQITQVQILAVATAIATVVNIALTVLTTKKIGLPPKGKLYEKVIEKTTQPPTLDYFDQYDDSLHVPDQTDPAEDVRVLPEPSTNSVNSGGKGLLGGN